MEEKTVQNFEETVNVFLEKAVNAEDAEEAKLYMDAASNGVGKLLDDKKIDYQEFDKHNDLIVNGLLVTGGALLTKLIELAFMNHQVNKSLKFEETGVVTTTSGKQFLNRIFRF